MFSLWGERKDNSIENQQQEEVCSKNEIEIEVVSEDYGSFVELKHGKTHYTLKGSEEKPLIIFCHGVSLYSFVWSHFVDLLSEDFRVLCFDFYGHGRSDVPNVAFEVPLFFEQLEELIQKLNLADFSQKPQKKLFLIGHSLGGLVSAHFAKKYPHLVEKLILFNCAGMQIEPWESLFPTFLLHATKIVRWTKSFDGVFHALAKFLKMTADRLDHLDEEKIHSKILDKSKNDSLKNDSGTLSKCSCALCEKLDNSKSPSLLTSFLQNSNNSSDHTSGNKNLTALSYLSYLSSATCFAFRFPFAPISSSKKLLSNLLPKQPQPLSFEQNSTEPNNSTSSSSLFSSFSPSSLLHHSFHSSKFVLQKCSNLLPNSLVKFMHSFEFMLSTWLVQLKINPNRTPVFLSILRDCPLLDGNYENIFSEIPSTIPVLLILGENDPLLPAKQQIAKFQKCLPHAKMLVVKEGDHAAFLTAFDDVSDLTKNFLEENENK